MSPELQQSLAGAPPQQWIASPSPVYLTGEEFLRVSSLGNTTGLGLTVTGRILRPDNTISRISFAHTPNSNRTFATTIVGLSEGWLLGLTIRCTSGGPAFGQVWTMLELGISSGATFTVDQTLGYGFLTANTPYQWPNGVNLLPLDGAGHLRSITGATPAAGAEVSETVPNGARWEFLALRLSFVTSVTVANRSPFLCFDDGANLYAQVTIKNQIPASSTPTLLFAQGADTPDGPSVAFDHGATPTNLRLGAGHRMRTITTAIQAADQYSAIQYLVREWMTGE